VFLHTVCVWPSVLCFYTQCACGRVFCVSIHSMRVAQCFVCTQCTCGRTLPFRNSQPNTTKIRIVSFL